MKERAFYQRAIMTILGVQILKDKRVEILLTMAAVWVLLDALSKISRVALWIGGLAMLVITFLWPE